MDEVEEGERVCMGMEMKLMTCPMTQAMQKQEREVLKMIWTPTEMCKARQR